MRLMFEGQEMFGVWTSITITVKTQEVELPVASVARNVTEEVPTGKTEPLEGPDTCITVGVLQLSVAVAVA